MIVAARLVLADGRRAFAKAVGSERNADSPEFHRREVAVLAALPTCPFPASIGSYDDGDRVALGQGEAALRWVDARMR